MALVAVAVLVAACSPSPVDPAPGLPVLVRFVHGQGSEDLLSVDVDGVVTGLLGPQDRDRPVGCVLDAAFVRDLGGAAAVDLEPGATEPAPDGVDVERMEVSGSRGSAWLGDGRSEVVRLATLLVAEVHRPEADRTFCRETPQTAPGDVTTGVVLRRWGGPARLADAAFVSDTGVVTGRTGRGVFSCVVPPTTVGALTTSPVPGPASEGPGDVVQVTVRRGSSDRPLPPAGTDPLSTTVRELLDDGNLPPAQRRLCRPRV